MPKYRVWGMMTVSVSVEVEADNEDAAIEAAEGEFGGLHNFAGNGGCDKLVGVYGSNESVEVDDNAPEWDTVDPV